MFRENHTAIQAATQEFYTISSGMRVFDCIDLLVRKKYLIIDQGLEAPSLLRAEMVISALLSEWLTPETIVDELAEQINHISPDASLMDAIDLLIRSEALIALVDDLALDEDSLLNFWLSQIDKGAA